VLMGGQRRMEKALL